MISNTNVCRTNAEIFVVHSPTNEKICSRMDAQRGSSRLKKSNKKPLLMLLNRGWEVEK